ncbi:hypothetical protein CUZ98_0953 [Enterococcus faecium]|nr:hypothetical protein [Enterococcus faecium]
MRGRSKMKIDKILNNNVVISKNGFGEEVVCMGKGLAFQKKDWGRDFARSGPKRICFKRFFC